MASGLAIGMSDRPDENIFNGSQPGNWCNLSRRSVRIGSYKVLTKDRIVITEKGVQIKFPAISNNLEIVTINIPMNDVLKVFIGSIWTMPILFLYISPAACKRIRASLAMNNRQSFFIDITSQDETQNRVTIVPEKLSNVDRMILKQIFSKTLQQVYSFEANEILERSSPGEDNTGRSAYPQPSTSTTTSKDKLETMDQEQVQLHDDEQIEDDEVVENLRTNVKKQYIELIETTNAPLAENFARTVFRQVITDSNAQSDSTKGTEELP